MTAPIALSTGLVRDATATDTAQALFLAGCRAIELSGGLPSPTIGDDVRALAERADVRLHNYFPPPAEPFVLNLASEDDEIAERSVRHVQGALDLCADIGSPYYSVHAGFLIDPVVGQLGAKISTQRIADRVAATARFLRRVEQLATRAARDGITLMLENNVLSAANHETFGENPLLMVEPEELVEVMERTPENVGVLLDVAHLKVSARTLGFDAIAMFDAAGPWIRGYHLSDNDGTADTNDPIRADSWFWAHIDPTVGYWSIEVKGLSAEDYVGQVGIAEGALS